VPIRFQKVPVLRHPDLLDKEINGVIDHADLSVTEAKLADGAVTSTKIASLAVTRAKIQDDAVDYSKLAEPAVRPTNIEADPLLIPVPAGKMLKSKADNLFEWVDPPVGRVELLADVAPATDVTQITITGLTMVGYRRWLFQFITRAPAAEGSRYDLFFNGDLTLANYYTQYILATGTSIGAGRSNTPSLFFLAADQPGYVVGNILIDHASYPRYDSRASRAPAAGIIIYLLVAARTITVTDITRLDIIATTTNGIRAGSRFTLWGIK